MDSNQIIAITRSFNDVLIAVKSSTRLKYQCLTVSSNLICLGATTGSVYIYDRHSGKLIKFISNKVDAVIQLRFSYNEKILAVADSSGRITCWEIEEAGQTFKAIKEIDGFNGRIITAMCWSNISSRLFVGDEQGLVMSFNVGFSKANFGLNSVATIRKSGDPIVQMDFNNGKLVISSTTKAILCFTDKEKFQPIGTKSRDGLYGACFLKSLKDNGPSVLYSARPGSRLWEVDINGQVLATHQFKELLAVPPSPIVTSKDVKLPMSDITWSQPQGFNFPYLHPVIDRYILTRSSKGIYVFEPHVGTVATWNDQIKEICEISCHENNIYILHLDSSLTELQLLSVKQCLVFLYKLEEWTELAEIACSRKEEILKDVESFLAIDFRGVLIKIQELDTREKFKELILNTESLIQDLEGRHAEIRAEVQERLNQMLNNSEPAGTSDSGVEDSDDIRSNISEGVSEGSSRISLSRLAEVNLENLIQKATNALVSKVVTAGFMKKALHDALQAEGVIVDEQGTRKSFKQTKSVPTSPSPKRNALQRAASVKDVGIGSDPRERYLQRKTKSVPSLSNGTAMNNTVKNITNNTTDEIVVQRGRSVRRSIRKKKRAKVITIETAVDEPSERLETNDVLTTTQSLLTNNANVLQKELSSNIVTVDNADGSNNLIHCSASTNLVRHSALPTEKDNHDNQVLFKLHVPKKEASNIISKLVSTTAVTRTYFRDPGKLYNSNAIYDILKTWSSQLSNVATEFQEECFKQLDVNISANMTNQILAYLQLGSNALLFQQLSAGFSEIANVAMLCLESGIYPEKCSKMKSHEIKLLNFEFSFSDIYTNAMNDIKQIQLLPAKDLLASPKITQSSTDASNSEAVEKCFETNSVEAKDVFEIESPSSLFADQSKTNFVFSTDKIKEEMLSKDINDLLFDRHSLSTIVSETETILGTCEMIFGHEDSELKEYPLLCENFNSGIESCEFCIIDKCRACFILRYFPVLNFSRIRSLLTWHDGCKWRTWAACLVHLKNIYEKSKFSRLIEEGNLSMISLELQENDDIEIFLANASKLNSISPTLLSRYFSEDRLLPWEVTLLYQTYYLTSKHREEFILYSFNQISTVTKKDALFLHCSLHTALEFHPRMQDLFCECGKVRPRSNHLEWKWQELILKLIGYVEKDYTVSDENMVKAFCRLCEQKGFWIGYLKLSSIVGDVKPALMVLYQLLDYDLMVDLFNQGYLKPTEEQWSHLLKEVAETIGENNSHTCEPVNGKNPTLTLEKLIKLAALHAGTRFVLSVVKKFKNTSILSCDVYMSLLRVAKLENRQDVLISNLIEVASNKVWSEQNKRLIHPEFETLKNCELQGNERMSVSPGTIVINEHVVEESDVVWGRAINLSSSDCPVCTLPLCLKTTSNSTTGLIVFQCGHSFHKLCLPETACLVCYHDNFMSLY